MSQHRDLRPFTVYLPKTAITHLQRRARRNERTVSAELRAIVREALRT